jgi:hypothetical protein
MSKNHNNGLSFWGVVGAVIVAFVILGILFS